MNLPARPSRDGAYDHARHAGNAADVFKHAALVALVDAARPTRIVETHAGRGRYHLGPQGEWRQGIGALLDADLEGTPAEVTRYLALLDARPSKKGVRYLGSPALAKRAAPDAELRLYEIDDDAASELDRAVPGADIRKDDGLAALTALAPPEVRELVVVDPPYVEKREWHLVGEAVAKAGADADRCILLWYPVKTLTRPNALIARLEGLKGVVVESSPHQGKLSSGALVGSGLIVVNPPVGFADRLIALAGWLTPRMSSGAWSMRARSL